MQPSIDTQKHIYILQASFQEHLLKLPVSKSKMIYFIPPPTMAQPTHGDGM